MAKREKGIGSTPGVVIFGVGGAGGNAVATLLRRPIDGMRIVCADSDVQALQTVPVGNRLQLGRCLTAGLGADARPELGRAAAKEALPQIEAALAGSALCFIAAGLGGGTGTGAAQVIAKAARAHGILTIAVATKPFAFEGKARARMAEAGAAALAAQVDVMVSVCNQRLLGPNGAATTLRAALDRSDAIIGESASDLALLLGASAPKRVELGDLHALLASSGHAAIGYGEASAGVDRAVTAARAALCTLRLEGAPDFASRLLITVTGGSDLGVFEVEEAISFLRASLTNETELVWGAANDPELAGRVRVGIIAAGTPPPAPVRAHSAPYRLPATSTGTALRPAPPRVTPPPPALSASAQLTLALDFAIAEEVAPVRPCTRAVVPRSAVMPSLANRVYTIARIIKRRIWLRPSSVSPPVTFKQPDTFQLLKAFDPPPRAPLNAFGPLAGIAGKTVMLN